MSEQFDEDYFLRGKQCGKSCYENYRWLPDLTIPMVVSILSYLKIRPIDQILDFGCARGYTVRAFREMGYDAWGIDVSEWAIRNSDEIIKQYLSCTSSIPPLLDRKFDWIIAKDVLEHVPNVLDTISYLMSGASKGIFVVVPLAEVDNEKYSIRCYEKDVTHIHRFTLATWVNYFLRPGWEVTATYRVRGVKDNYAKYPLGNGFITARRLLVEPAATQR